MHPARQLPTLYRSLRQQKLRTLLSMLGVIFGVVSMTAMFSIGEGAKEKILRHIEQLGIHNIILKTPRLTEAQKLHARERLSGGISREDTRMIRAAVPAVADISPLIELKASLTGIAEELYPSVIAVSPSFQAVERIALSGRFISPLDQSRRNFVCVLGAEIARKLGPGGAVGKTVRIETEMFKITGILAPRTLDAPDNPVISPRDLNRAVMIPLSTAGYVDPGTLEGHYSEVNLHVPDKHHIIAAANRVKSLLERNHRSAEDVRVIVPLELLNKQRQAQDHFTLFLGSIAFISLLVGGIGIMNIMLANVSERTREIGIRRAVGANRRHIRAQFLLEALAISLAGGMAGVILGIIATAFISLLGQWNTVIRWWFILLSIVMAAAVGISSGVYPALKASRMDPIRALRNE